MSVCVRCCDLGWNIEKAFKTVARAAEQFWCAQYPQYDPYDISVWNDVGNGIVDAACKLQHEPKDAIASLKSVGINSKLSNDLKCSLST